MRPTWTLFLPLLSINYYKYDLQKMSNNLQPSTRIASPYSM